MLVTERTELPEVEIVAGENAPEVPLGRPATASDTVPVKPDTAPTFKL